MAKISHRPAAKMRRPIGSQLLDRVSWDDLRVFAVAARALSLRKAATAMRTSSSTVVRRIEKIETALEPRFQEHFVNAMALPHKTDGFPNLAAEVRLPERSSAGSQGRRRHRG